MPEFQEGKLACDFPPSWAVAKYDNWAFYRNRFVACCGGSKAVDFLALDSKNRALYLIEVKDYRRFIRTKNDMLLWEEVAFKVRDTLAGLVAAKMDATSSERFYAKLALDVRKLRVVLHLEQPRTSSKLFPRAFDRAYVQQKLKQMLKPIDAHPCVVELAHMGGLPWTTTSIP